MHIYISGGCKNGKSHLAQRLAKALGTPLYYLATMIPADAEDEARIARHIADRDGWGFETIECGRSILTALDGADPAGSFLLDSVTALLANEMFPPGGFDPSAPERVASELEEFVRRTSHAVLVSDFIFGDAALYDETTEAYVAGLARIDRRLAAASDALLEVSAGRAICHRGREALSALDLPELVRTFAPPRNSVGPCVPGDKIEAPPRLAANASRSLAPLGASGLKSRT